MCKVEGQNLCKACSPFRLLLVTGREGKICHLGWGPFSQIVTNNSRLECPVWGSLRMKLLRRVPPAGNSVVVWLG